MIVEIDQERLAYYLPFTRDVKGSKIYESYLKGLAQADEQLRVSLLGRALYSKLQELFADDKDNHNENENDNDDDNGGILSDTDYRIGSSIEELKLKIEEYICNQAAYLTLGHHNVMQSHLGGFTTATGQNEVVASQARIDDLREECQRTAESAFDMLVKMLIGNANTADLARESSAWIKKTSLFFWSADEAREYVSLSAPGYMQSGSGAIAAMLMNTNPMLRYAKEIQEAHTLIIKKISREQTNALLNKMRSGEVTEIEADVIRHLKNIYSAMMLKAQTHVMDVAHELSQIFALLEDNLEMFPEYEGSEAYAARHTQGFENKKCQPGYWFV